MGRRCYLYLPWSGFGADTIFSAIFLPLNPVVLSSVFPRTVVSGVGVLRYPVAFGWMGAQAWSHRVPPSVGRMVCLILCYVTDRRAFSKDQRLDARQALLHRSRSAAAAVSTGFRDAKKDLSGKECAALTSAAIERVADGLQGSRVRLAFS